MAVIELGIVNDDPGPGPGRRPRPDRRRVLATLMTVVCLLTAAGSAPPDHRGPRQLWTSPLARDTDGFRLAGDTVYVLTRAGSPRLSARDARSGVVRWSSIDIEDKTRLTTVEAGVLLLATGVVRISRREPDGFEAWQDFSRDTLAIDAATGRPLWRLRGEVMAVIGDRVVLSEWNDSGKMPRLLRAVRLRDGGTIWSRPRQDLDLWVTDAPAGTQAERLVGVNAQGRVEVLAPADGSVVATGVLPWTDPSRVDANSRITVRGQRLYLDQTASVGAYDTKTLRLRWRKELASAGGSYPCGPLICLADQNGTTGYDADTGMARWHLPTIGAVLVADRLLIDSDTGRRTLVDANSGRLLAELGAATPVRDPQGYGAPYLVAPGTQPVARTAVSAFNPVTGEARPLGTIGPIRFDTCQGGNGLLACRTPDDRLTVTAVG